MSRTHVCQHAMVHGIMRPNLCCIHHGCMCTRLHAQSLRSHSQPPCLGGSAAPVVSAVAQNSARSGGGSLTVMGLGFGTKDYTATASFSLAICRTSSWSSGTTVTCLGSSTYSDAISSVVSVSALVGSASGLFTFDGLRPIDMPIDGLRPIEVGFEVRPNCLLCDCMSCSTCCHISATQCPNERRCYINDEWLQYGQSRPLNDECCRITAMRDLTLDISHIAVMLGSRLPSLGWDCAHNCWWPCGHRHRCFLL